MSLFDVVVIGGGPAGAATAYHLASQGVRVAVIDKATFPRDKACGDILSKSALQCLKRMEMAALLATYGPQDAWQGHLSGPGGRVITHQVNTRDREGNLKYATIPRRVLDAALLERAQAAGATVFEHVAANKLETESNGVNVIASGVNGNKLAGRLAVIAEGSVGGLSQRPQASLFAIRGYYSDVPDNKLILRWEADLLPGYEWQFPIPGVPGLSNIGLFTTRDRARHLRADHRLNNSSLVRGKTLTAPLRGGLVNTSFAQAPAHAERILYVGDAAGLVQPHLGEGLYPALRSGEIAAECSFSALAANRLQVSDLAVYTSRLHTAFDNELRLSRGLFWCMHHPQVFNSLLNLVANNYGRIFRLLGKTKSKQ